MGESHYGLIPCHRAEATRPLAVLDLHWLMVPY